MEFKESPTSRKVIKNLPTMDIIREEDGDDDPEYEMTDTEGSDSLGFGRNYRRGHNAA